MVGGDEVAGEGHDDFGGEWHAGGFEGHEACDACVAEGGDDGDDGVGEGGDQSVRPAKRAVER